MMDMFDKWISKEAEWYHFWLPQSSSAGGLIMGFIIMIALIIIMEI